MKHLPAIGASLLLCASLIIPQAIYGAPAAERAATVEKSARKTVKKEKAAHADKSAKRSRKAPKKSRANADSPRKSAKKDRPARKLDTNKELAKKDKDRKPISPKSGDAGEREVWLKRARASEALTGKASWYGKDFHNKATASGLAYDMHTFTAAHRTLPMGTVVKVTDQKNGKSVMVCVTDRGPYVPGRIIDVSYAAATQLGLRSRGVGNVKLEVVSDERGEPLRKDQAYFVRYASQAGKNKVGPFHAFADAAAMQEALRQAHPEAEVILDKAVAK